MSSTTVRSCWVLSAAVLALVGSERAGRAEPFWQRIAPRKTVEADPAADYTLTEENGPWLILAASFSGERAVEQAEELVMEIRSGFNLPAFHYDMTFRVEDDQPGRGIDSYGGRIKRRYRQSGARVEHAVLVGEFPAIDDPEAQRLLQRVKRLQPDCLMVDDPAETAQSLASVRKQQRAVKKMLGKGEKGPMGHAFMTRNPILPREYFVPQAIDQEVAKWNKDVKHSLLDCPGRFSIKVATFRGRVSLKAANDDLPDRTDARAPSKDDPLVVAAQNAHKLTIALREKGWEAYEFHDRRESYVTVGSFDKGEKLPSGQIIVPEREAQIIVNTFGAHSKDNIFNRPAPQDQQLEEQKKQEFFNRLGGGAQSMGGFNPKRFVGLPFDIYPAAVSVPQTSLTTAYMR